MFRKIHITFDLFQIKIHQSESPPKIVINLELEENSNVRKTKVLKQKERETASGRKNKMAII